MKADWKDRNTSRGIPSGFEDLANTENQWRRVGSNHRQMPYESHNTTLYAYMALYRVAITY